MLAILPHSIGSPLKVLGPSVAQNGPIGGPVVRPIRAPSFGRPCKWTCLKIHRSLWVQPVPIGAPPPLTLTQHAVHILQLVLLRVKTGSVKLGILFYIYLDSFPSQCPVIYSNRRYHVKWPTVVSSIHHPQILLELGRKPKRKHGV